VTQNGKTRDPIVLKARYLENGWR